MEYRPLPDDRKEQFQEYVEYAFSPEDGPQDEYDWDPDEQPGDERALFDGDSMLCVCRHYWFRTHLRDQQFEMPGLSAVASPPQHRRQGHVTRLLGESLREYRDRGDVLTALWAFEHPFYERQGWGLANKWTRYECDPEALAWTRDDSLAGGEFRPIDADEYERLDSVLAAADAGYELGIERTEAWWRERIFSGWQTDPYAYGWESEDGELRGYLVYRVKDEVESEGKRLHVSDFAAADREARVNLLRFLADHDSQVERVSVNRPLETTLLDSATDPADVDCEIKPGPMVRLVDVPAAFEALDYPDAPDASFTVRVSDSLADWNDGTFRVRVEGGRATCERTAGEAEADVVTGVSALSQVYVGYHSVADAESLTDLDVRTPVARETLSAMFPERDVFLREGF
ncbi:enhanced intracellular survival protein Eis [Halorussus sp. MSC15.2]|uniref:GNAT family N-acetyltransferase n=1 Tax=Halorussus sp. MSC15.2 TaxID=2283638 RepID=UPI0013D00E2B|nr:GNAT family N-acetyltransferase [Halorussus sp. MSC15.2]NEU57017.1 GNAT family N-acetyltransferase [Halorussus sp. MSC15.2]